ncbi:sigma factor [Limnoglobus roseus]|uniref:Sigma-70 family RNA polymerase sigma factor n=1 Tax=Limnoglobus roseus TaxID=2598579 RepID=A0A5C1ARI2_9BACT|nr:sigma factor [Limnoglobus roseus]QEL20683.1 sigma-70 family RNA polymerase sigma factor [Limnoglobus roseus]
MFPSDAVVGAFAHDLIRRKARRLARRADVFPLDADDIGQELRLALVRALPQYDPARGTVEAFVVTTVQTAVAMLLRERHASKRAVSRVRPLASDVACPFAAADQAAADRRLDVHDRLAGLPSSLQPLAVRLTTQSLAEAARALGTPRSSLQRRVAHIRRHFQTTVSLAGNETEVACG